MQNSIFASWESVPQSKVLMFSMYGLHFRPENDGIAWIVLPHVVSACVSGMFPACRISSEHFERSPIKYRVACNGMSSNQVDAYFAEM